MSWENRTVGHPKIKGNLQAFLSDDDDDDDDDDEKHKHGAEGEISHINHITSR